MASSALALASSAITRSFFQIFLARPFSSGLARWMRSVFVEGAQAGGFGGWSLCSEPLPDTAGIGGDTVEIPQDRPVPRQWRDSSPAASGRKLLPILFDGQLEPFVQGFGGGGFVLSQLTIGPARRPMRASPPPRRVPPLFFAKLGGAGKGVHRLHGVDRRRGVRLFPRPDFRCRLMTGVGDGRPRAHGGGA